MKSIKLEKVNHQMTQKLLHMISERTSGRKDFNNLEYVVVISETQEVTFGPARCVYRNNHAGVKYTTDEMIADILNRLDNFNHFVPGTYRYCYYTPDKFRRRWIKED